MEMNDIQIRKATIEDFNDVMLVEELAFGHEKEAQLTADLINDETAEPILSLLAYSKDKAVGHILFTRVYINKMDANQPMLHILAPLAVVPEFQKHGIGGLLINEGCRMLREMGSEMVFVLGHMDYYPKYGFIPDAKKNGYEAPYPIPEEFANAWMVQPLNNKGFDIDTGKVLCANQLNKPEHWRE